MARYSIYQKDKGIKEIEFRGRKHQIRTSWKLLVESSDAKGVAELEADGWEFVEEGNYNCMCPPGFKLHGFIKTRAGVSMGGVASRYPQFRSVADFWAEKNVPSYQSSYVHEGDSFSRVVLGPVVVGDWNDVIPEA